MKTIHGRDELQRLARLPCFFQLSNLRVGNVVKLQFIRRGFVEHRRARVIRGSLIGCQQIFHLRAVKLRRINLKQWLAAMHQLAGGIRVELFNPALELRGDIRQRRFVVINRAHRPNRLPQRPAHNRCRAQVHVLSRDGINRNHRRIFRRVCAAAV